MQKVQLSWPELDSQQWNEVSYLQLLVLHSGARNFFEIIMQFESKVQVFLVGHKKKDQISHFFMFSYQMKVSSNS